MTFFALWGLGFWILAGISAIIFSITSKTGAHFLSTLALLIMGGVYASYLPLKESCFVAIIYLFVGVIWSLYKWFRHVTKIAEGSSVDERIEYMYQRSTKAKHNQGNGLGEKG